LCSSIFIRFILFKAQLLVNLLALPLYIYVWIDIHVATCVCIYTFFYHIMANKDSQIIAIINRLQLLQLVALFDTTDSDRSSLSDRWTTTPQPHIQPRLHQIHAAGTSVPDEQLVSVYTRRRIQVLSSVLLADRTYIRATCISCKRGLTPMCLFPHGD